MKRTPASGWLAGGSVLTAIFASACCWLPLVAVLAGAAATGVAAVLWTARPWLLTGSAVLLGAGFWMSYRRRPVCEPGSTCAAPVPGRFHRAMLWIAAGGLVVAALFPNLVGLLTHDGSFALASSTEIELPVEGMTCAGCEHAVERSLQAVDGVVAVHASAADARVVVMTADASRPPHDALVAAIAAAGYRAPEGPAIGGHWEGTLGEGEDAATLVADLGTTEGGRWIGEMDFPSQGLDNISLQVGVEGRAVRLVVPLPDEVVFAGELSTEGDSLVGRFSQGDTELPFLLTRSGEAALSKELLAMEAGGEDAQVTVLSDDWRELKQAFNDGAGRTRLLMLLSPT